MNRGGPGGGGDSQTRIPNLNYAKVKNKNNFFQNPLLTPVTFVSKDKQMRADYLIDPEYDEATAP